MHGSSDFNTLKKVCLAIGIPALAVSCYMTWKFGDSISSAHGIGLALATVFAAIIFALRAHVLSMLGAQGFDTKWPGRGLAALGCFFVFFEFVGDLGYTFGMRDKQVVEAGAQTVAYDTVQGNLKSEQANIGMWREQLSSLKARNAEHMKKNNGWLVTTDPTAMQSQLDAMDTKISNEASRVRCAAKCESLKVQRGNLAAMIAGIKEENDLTGRIEATQRTIDSKVTTATTTKIGHSTTKAQNKAFARIGLLLTGTDATDALSPGETSQTWADYIIGLLMATAACALPPVAFYFAFWQAPSRAPSSHADNSTSLPPVSEIGNRTSDTRAYIAPVGIPSEPIHVHTVETVHSRDKALARWALSDEVRAILAGQGQGQLRAA